MLDDILEDASQLLPLYQPNKKGTTTIPMVLSKAANSSTINLGSNYQVCLLPTHAKIVEDRSYLSYHQAFAVLCLAHPIVKMISSTETIIPQVAHPIVKTISPTATITHR